jgi:virulence factor Mce-like protein
VRGGQTPGAKRAIGLATMAAALVAVTLAFHPPTMPWTSPLRLHLEAAGFGTLNKSAGVELGGVKVGTVDAVRWQNGRAVLDLSIDHAYAGRVHGDASATIRPHGLLGPKYVDLDGGRSGRMPDGGTIPLARVHVTQDVDQVLNALQPDVRDNLKTVLVELGNASAGRGQDVNDALRALGQSAADLRTVTDTLQQRDVDLANFFVYSEQLNRDVQYAPVDAQIRDTNTVLTALVGVENNIGDGIDQTAIVVRQLDIVMDGNSDNLAYVLSHSPATILRLRTVVSVSDQLVQGISPGPTAALMVAVIETKSAFSYSDANGHYVRVLSIGGSPCVVGVPGSGVCSTPNGKPGSGGPAAHAAPAAPHGSSTDQQLVNLLMGSG